MKRILIVSLLMFAPVLLAQNAIPSGTILPTSLNSSLNSEKTKPDNNNRETADTIEVIGHLALPGAVVTNIRTTEDLTRHLLEVTDSRTHTLNLIDVADPSHPKIFKRVQKPDELQNSRLELEVGNAALFAETQDATARATRRSVSVLSFADPEKPKTVRKFEDVTALLVDRGQGLIYLTNPDGLWILRPHSTVDEAAQQKFEQQIYTP